MRFTTILKRGQINNEMYVIGLIHGLQIALCDIDSETLGYDCEMFEKFVYYVTDTTQDKFDIFRKTVEKIHPGLCEFKMES